MSQQSDKRRAFEKWLMAAAPGRFHEESFDIDRHGDYYENAETHLFWTVWKAGCASAASHALRNAAPQASTSKDQGPNTQVSEPAVAAPSTTPRSATPRTDALSDRLGTDMVRAFSEMQDHARQLERELAEREEQVAHWMRESAASATPLNARPISEWHDDIGNVIWWRIPVEEPPWVGTPLDDGWLTNDEGEPYYTHFTPLVIPANARADGGKA